MVLPRISFGWPCHLPTLGAIRQPFNLARLRRFVERPAHLGGTSTVIPSVSLPAEWASHCGKHIDKVSASDLAEFCIGYELQFSFLVISTRQIIINTRSPDRARCVLMIHIEITASCRCPYTIWTCHWKPMWTGMSSRRPCWTSIPLLAYQLRRTGRWYAR